MRSETENIYKLLPFDNLIKFNIYSQMYKNHECPYRDEIVEYPLFRDVKDSYFAEKNVEESDRDCMYRLFKDITFHLYKNISQCDEEHESSMIEAVAFQVYVELMNANYLRATPESLEIRARKLWNNMSLEQKKRFIKTI